MYHGQIVQVATDLGKPDAIAKGYPPNDAAVATRAVDNIAAIASVIIMDQWPEGSEFEKFADSHAMTTVLANQPGFSVILRVLQKPSFDVLTARSETIQLCL